MESTPGSTPTDNQRGAKHLLIVDDEPVILQILRAVFEDEPYRLSTAGTGHDARRVLDEHGCDILITDKNLPDVSGLELLRLARERNPYAEVIVITGYASLETAVEALELGAFDYVLKPLNNVFDIRKKVRQAIVKQEMALENQRLINRLTEQNARLERALEEARTLQQELIQSEKLAGIGTLAAGVAHEISSPLFGIMGLAEAIVDEPDRALTVQYATDIVEYSKNIRDIVVELSSYSRTSNREYMTNVDVPRVIEDALRLVERSTSVQGVNFKVQLDERGPMVVSARTNEIQQVFVNLIRNAAEAVQERHGREGGGRVEIEAGPGDGFVWARVRDNGVSIPEDKVGVIFDPFYTTKPPGKGTGLGLNVVFRILTKYRGTISVDSRVGEGTVFTLKIPVEA